MSMEMCVLSDARLNSISEWQKAIERERFPLVLSYDRPFMGLKGFLPSYLSGKRTGFECHHVEPRELIDTYEGIQFDREWKYALAFIWIGDFNEMQAAWMAATAYARATAGVVFDEEAGQILTPVQALKVVQDNERVLPQLEVEMRKSRDRS